MEAQEKVFKTEEERNKAIEEIPNDVPQDVASQGDEAIEKWISEQEQLTESLVNAKIDSEYQAQSEDKKEETKEEQPGEKVPTQPVDDMTRERLLHLERERDTIYNDAQRQAAESKKQLDEAMARIKALEEERTKAPETRREEQPSEDLTIKTLRAELQGVENKMKEADPVEYPKEYAELMNKKMDLVSKLQDKTTITLERKYAAEIQKIKDDYKKEQQTRIDEEKKRQEQAQKEKASVQAREAMLRDIDTFQTKNKDFQVNDEQGKPVSYENMYQNYRKFAQELAADYWRKTAPSTSKEEQEIAVAKYLQNPLLLGEGLKRRGVNEPKDFRHYLMLSELVYLQRGWRLNPTTGQYEQYVDGAGNQVRFPTMEDAWDHLQKLKGKKGEELLKAQLDGARGAVEAMQQRANPKELDREHQGREKPLSDMSEEEALKKLNLVDEKGNRVFDEERIAQMIMETKSGKPLPAIVQEFNKIMKVLGQEPMTKEMFEEQ
jgi:hypothetical protein